MPDYWIILTLLRDFLHLPFCFLFSLFNRVNKNKGHCRKLPLSSLCYVCHFLTHIFKVIWNQDHFLCYVSFFNRLTEFLEMSRSFVLVSLSKRSSKCLWEMYTVFTFHFTFFHSILAFSWTVTSLLYLWLQDADYWNG